MTMAMNEQQQQPERGVNDSWEDIQMTDYDDDDDNDEDYQPDDDDESSQDDEEDDEEDEDLDDSSQSLWTELAKHWKQHMIAVCVAIAATAVAYSSQAVIPSSLMMQLAPTTSSFSSSSQRIHETHAHLKNYHRTANISFCGHGQGIVIVEDDGDDDDITTASTTATPSDMRTMDFNIPKKLIPTLALHYAADLLQDDDYTSLLNHNNANDNDDYDNPAAILVRNHHAEYACLQQQQESSPKNYIRGVTSFYKTPDIESMYPNEIKRSQELSVKQKAVTIQPAQLSFTGFAAKFVNLSPKPVLLHWESSRDDKSRLVGEIAPFESIGTATTPGQSFAVTPVYDSTHALERWTVTADDAVSTYAPKDFNSTKLSPIVAAHYQMQLLNAAYAKHYLIHSGRIWLAHFPRAFPVHPMWEASYFGQQHSVSIAGGPTTSTTTTTTTTTVGDGGAAVDESHHHHSQSKKKTYKLTVASVTPRVFTIPNFLSAQECQQLIELAQQQGLKGSTVFSGGNMAANRQREGSTRSSSNAWLARSSMNVTDQIYRRAAALLQIDESLLQASSMGDDLHAHQHATAESLQIVNYQQGQSYSAHHDFVYPPVSHRLQPTRFATLLFYLNDDFEGGRTVFPRAVNAHHHEGISIKPVRGTAVLFYNMLPDGNVDDLSQHTGEAVVSGEKFIGNLWIWDPAIN
jgi:prolyl 4-hydroxylase